MISRGLFSDQLLKDNNYYGFDMPMVYFDLYLPQIFQGMNIRIGRIISEPDIEAQLAPNNLMSSHSLVYGFDNYTQTGIFTTTKINDQWTIPARSLQRDRRCPLAERSRQSADRHGDDPMDCAEPEGFHLRWRQRV